jgi:uncharacterized protein YuzE
VKIIYDKKTDTLSIILRPGKAAESDEARPGLILDYDKSGGLISLELLDASEQVKAPNRSSSPWPAASERRGVSMSRKPKKAEKPPTSPATAADFDAVLRLIDAFERAGRVLPGGVNGPARAFGAVGGRPLFIARGEGPYIYDIDGNQYLGYVGSWGRSSSATPTRASSPPSRPPSAAGPASAPRPNRRPSWPSGSSRPCRRSRWCASSARAPRRR